MDRGCQIVGWEISSDACCNLQMVSSHYDGGQCMELCTPFMFLTLESGNVTFKWIELYTTAFDGSHTYMFRQQEKHIDLHLVRRPVCDLGTCDGIMQTLDARHIELFLSEEYRSGSWEYHLLESHNVYNQADVASAGIFDIKHLNDESTSDIFDLKSWVGKQNDWKPKAMITLHAVAVNTNLQDNEGLQIKYHAMRAGKDGKVVSIRISQQLLQVLPLAYSFFE